MANNLSSNKLPLALRQPIRAALQANSLAIAFTHPLGALSSERDSTTEAPPRRLNSPRACLDVRQLPTRTLHNSRNWGQGGALIHNNHATLRTDSALLKQCLRAALRSFVAIDNPTDIWRTDSVLLKQCQTSHVSGYSLIYNCNRAPLAPTVSYQSCLRTASQATQFLRHCKAQQLGPLIQHQSQTTQETGGHLLHRSIAEPLQKALPVPCRYYPIPEKPPAPKPRACRRSPPSSRLPLSFKRRHSPLPSKALPLPLMCWHDAPPRVIPNLRGYLVHNIITATIGGISIDPIAFNITTNINSYCFSASLDITPRDFEKIKTKLNVARGQEPLINVVINGKTFTILAETHHRVRKFAHHTHTISGRSLTARLGEDYAKAQSGLLNQANYASQIARQQLNGLGITLDWGINDWLIPANQYAVSDKTPIAVIADIAKAAGGFVMSDETQPILSVKPKWKAPAWEIATTAPDEIIPIDIIREISDQRRINPRYNTVLLTSNIEGGHVYRKQQTRDLTAPIEQHPLYTDRDAILPAGIATLSDSGIHADYRLTLRFTDKYNIPLAQLGQIWQINDPEGNWRGIITGITLNVHLDNDAPTVWQTITIDRYLDT